VDHPDSNRIPDCVGSIVGGEKYEVSIKYSTSRRRFLRNSGGLLVAACSTGFINSCSATPSRQKGVRFVFYTDVHARTEWDTPVAMAHAARAINAAQPDFVIGGGDLITDGFQNSAVAVAPRWDAYMAMHQSINADIYPTIGNHDLVGAIPEDRSKPAKDPRAIYLDRMGLEKTWYTFNVAGYRFFVLDSIRISQDEFKYHGHVSSEQIEWLKEELALTPHDMPLIIVLHIPLLTVFYEATKGATFGALPNRVVTNNIEVMELFENHNLLLVLQGHIHVSERLWWRNTTFITGGAICARWWRGPWHGTEEGFNIITLQDNKIDWQYINYGWEAKRPHNR
jgi:3',5'-cyclic AMP phosphodiesterase CpdA